MTLPFPVFGPRAVALLLLSLSAPFACAQDGKTEPLRLNSVTVAGSRASVTEIAGTVAAVTVTAALFDVTLSRFAVIEALPVATAVSKPAVPAILLILATDAASELQVTEAASRTAVEESA